MKSGIYSIRNLINGKFYIGSALNIKARWAAHKSDLSRGIHTNSYLQRAWAKYGPEAFEFVVLEMVEPELLFEREQSWLDDSSCHRSKGGYNVSPTAGTCRGVKHTLETRQRMSAAKKGRPASNKGKRISDEQRLALSERTKKRAQTEAGKANLARMALAAKSAESRRKRSESKKGKKASDEVRARMSLSQTLRWQGASEEERQSHAAARIGRKFVYKTSPTPEHVAAMARLRQGGLSFRELGTQFGFSEECVRKNLIKYFGKAATSNPVREQKVRDIIRMRDIEGMTFEAIGAHFGNSNVTAHKLYHKYRNQ